MAVFILFFFVFLRNNCFFLRGRCGWIGLRLDMPREVFRAQIVYRLLFNFLLFCSISNYYISPFLADKALMQLNSYFVHQSN